MSKVWRISNCGQYRIESLSRETINGAIKVILEAFCPDEIACTGACVSGNLPASRELAVLCADAAMDAVSLVAIHIESGEVAAVSFNKIQTPSSEDEVPYFEWFAKECCTDPSAQSLCRFMLQVDAKCNLFEKYSVNCLLEIMFLATLKDHRKHGLGLQLSETSLDLARVLKKGAVSTFSLQDLPEEYHQVVATRTDETPRVPQLCSAIFTSRVSQKIGIALNFEKVAEVPYDEFTFDGKTYAERIGPENPDSWLVAKKLE